MLTDKIHPKTLSGIKRLASQLRREHGVKHSAALELASKAASCENYKHALRTLPDTGLSLKHPCVFLTIYWCDEEQNYRRGRETLRIELPRPILELCTKSDLRRVRGFLDLRMVAEDHFVSDEIAHSQEYARNRICTAERSLRFIEQTGLRPCRNYQKAHPKRLAGDKLPNNDHGTHWIDPACDQFILVDEPYSLSPNETARAAWADRNGWRIVKTSWPGMYNPYDCDLYVATDVSSGYDLDPLVAKINAMPPPLIQSDWSGESSSSWETFLSPMSSTQQDKRRARSRGTVFPVASRSTFPYSYRMGSTQRRPAGNLGVAKHKTAGRVIKAILNTRPISPGVYDRLSSLRSVLEDWLALEIGRDELPGRELFDVYYNDTDDDRRFCAQMKTDEDFIERLDGLRQLLKDAYPDCAPLRQQLRRIDMSVSLMRKAQPTDS